MTTPNEDREVIERLFDAYVENDLTDDQRAELVRWMEQGNLHVDRFVRESFLHWHLFEILSRRDLHGAVMSSSAADEAMEDQAVATATARGREVTSGKPLARKLRAIIVAACVVIVAGIGVWSALRRPETVAQLTSISPGVAWHSAESSLSVGTLLRTGQSIHIERGRALATLVSGTKVVIEGPAECEFVGKNGMKLIAGRLGAEVPTQATGFAVNTKLVEFVDLGTKFTLDVTRQDVCELQVFAGMVMMQPSRGQRGSVRVPEGRAVRCDGPTGEVITVRYDVNQQMLLQ